MATLVKYTTHEAEVRILYEYLAEASVVFPKVFPVIHSLLDAKITNVLSLCHDKTILAAVQSIIENMIACEDEKSQQQLHFLQVRKFKLISDREHWPKVLKKALLFLFNIDRTESRHKKNAIKNPICTCAPHAHKFLRMVLTLRSDLRN